MGNESKYTFEISLSVLNHLGRNLYRSFTTVLGEAVSNSWDAEAKTVEIHIDRDSNSFWIKDDGTGMSSEDFQGKFLKIGYSKRKFGDVSSPSGRPYIGRKGIGKLALLSCADSITIISKKDGGGTIGGTINNGGLDKAITKDLTTSEYALDSLEDDSKLAESFGLNNGTIIVFTNVKEGIKRTVPLLKKVIALYFRFSLLDPDFKIILNGQPVGLDSLDDLSQKTEFLWEVNNYIEDPYLSELTEIKKRGKITCNDMLSGFFASVEKPSHLNILGTGEKVGVDLFVNGRLRERDILKHVPTTRLVESYLYGQIHFNDLDDEKDRFASSREGIVADDEKFEILKNTLKSNIIPKILNDWDNWRRKFKSDGDSENTKIPPKVRKSEELFNAVSNEYELPKDSTNKKLIQKWVDSLSEDATFNFTSYAECFISENLIREYIQYQSISLNKEANNEYEKYARIETQNKEQGNISIDIREGDNKLLYLSMDHLANLVDKRDRAKEASLSRDAKEYKPMRDAMAHTSRLTDDAKSKLSSVYKNIQSRIKKLLENS